MKAYGMLFIISKTFAINLENAEIFFKQKCIEVYQNLTNDKTLFNSMFKPNGPCSPYLKELTESDNSSIFRNLISHLDYYKENENLPTTMDILGDYGCWCQFNNYPIKGHGVPLSEIDNLCKEVYEGYKCLEIDSLQGENCDPFNIDYNTTDCYHIKYKPAFQLDDCTKNTCKIEDNFLYAIWKIFKRDYFIGRDGPNMEELKGSNLDRKNECQGRGIGQPDKSTCCGPYPTGNYGVRDGKFFSLTRRRPFSSDTHSCCDNKIVDIGGC